MNEYEETKWRQLKRLLHSKSLKLAPKGEEFTLASGKKSKYFLDVKKIALTAEGHDLIGSLACYKLFRLDWPVLAVAGVALGGCPLASSVVCKLNEYVSAGTTDRKMDALYIRTEVKDHGTKQLIEGEATPGLGVVLFKDVITTGGSTIAAIKALQEAGCVVHGVLVIVDRLEGGRQAIEALGIPVESFYKINDILPFYTSTPGDPVHFDTEQQKWFFCEETWADRQGPFDTEDQARTACKQYADSL